MKQAIMKQTVAFRVDASHDVGFGHLKRCLLIANEAQKKKKNTKIIFITKEDPEALRMIAENHFETSRINKGIKEKEELDFLKKIICERAIGKIVIDVKEEISKQQVDELKKTGAKIILVDNCGEGRKNADVVIYPVAHATWLLKGIRGKIYHGWKYVLINPQFCGSKKCESRKRKKTKKRNPKKKILVTMGGSDVHNITLKILNALEKIKQDFECVAVIGLGFKKKNILVPDKRFIIKKNVANMAKLMLSSDIGIVLFGVSAYEAAAARLPCIIISDSERNKRAATVFKKFKTSIYLGDYKKITINKIKNSVEALIANKKICKRMSKKRRNVDCKGVLRIADLVLNA